MVKSASANEEEKLTKEQLKELKKQEKLKKQKAKKDKNDNKEKKPGLFRKLKDAWLELKKVTWPTFLTVVKKTGVVIFVVLLFTVVLFGIDYSLGLLFKLFVKS